MSEADNFTLRCGWIRSIIGEEAYGQSSRNCDLKYFTKALKGISYKTDHNSTLLAFDLKRTYMQFRNVSDSLCGILLIIGGLIVAIYSKKYGIGTMANIGSGFFPMILGYMLSGLGAIIFMTEFRKTAQMKAFYVRPFVVVASAILAFVFALNYLGMVAAIFVVVSISSVARPKARIIPTLVLAFVISLISIIVFKYLLRIQMPLFGGLH